MQGDDSEDGGSQAPVPSGGDMMPGAETPPARVAGEDGDEGVVDPRLDRLIGQNLKAHYDDILAAPLPDKFIVLLAQLAAKEGSS